MDEKLKLLNPIFRRQVEQLLANSAKLGYNLVITSGFRTQEEQDKLYAQGRTAPGQIVTNLKGNDIRAMHTKGLAVDLVDKERGYEINWPEIGSIGKKLGMFHGGDFYNFQDNPHFQYMITYKFSVVNQSSKAQEEIDKYLYSAFFWLLGYSITLIKDYNNPDCVIIFKDGETAGGGAAIQNPKPYAITITIGDEYVVFPNGIRVFQGRIYQNIIHEILHCIFKDNDLGDIHDIESKENIRMSQLNNDVAVNYLFRHIGNNNNKKMKYVILPDKNQYLLYSKYKLAFAIADEIELKLLFERGLVGSPELIDDLDGYIIYPLVNQNRLRDIFNI